MKYTYQYRTYPLTSQKLTLNSWLRICCYWYNWMLGERFDWWEQNRCPVNACPLVCHLRELKDKPNYYNQKRQLPDLKTDLIKVGHSGELLDFGQVYSTVMQDVCKRVEKAFNRLIQGDKNGKRSGKPRFKNQARYRTLVFANADNSWLKFCTINGKWLYIQVPKIGLLPIRTHRHLPEGATLKQVSLTRKSDGWYINLSLEDKSVPDFNSDEIEPTWENSVGLDAVLDKDVYLASSEGDKLPSLKPLRQNLGKLEKVSQKRNQRRKGTKARRQLAKREGRINQKIAKSRKDFQYKTAHKLIRTGKKVFFYEDLNLKDLTCRNKAKQDDQENYLPNSQSAKSGLNKSWLNAAFGQFFDILGQVAAKANARTVPCKPDYTSQLLSYRDEFVFTDYSIRSYWDEDLKLLVDRDINAAVNIKRVGLGAFPTIKRRRGKPVVVASTTNSTSKEILTTLRRYQKPTLKANAERVGASLMSILSSELPHA